MQLSQEKCVVCGKRIEMVDYRHHHHCDPKILARIDGNAKRDPTPATGRNWVTRFAEGMRLLNQH